MHQGPKSHAHLGPSLRFQAREPHRAGLERFFVCVYRTPRPLGEEPAWPGQSVTPTTGGYPATRPKRGALSGAEPAWPAVPLSSRSWGVTPVRSVVRIVFIRNSQLEKVRVSGGRAPCPSGFSSAEHGAPTLLPSSGVPTAARVLRPRRAQAQAFRRPLRSDWPLVGRGLALALAISKVLSILELCWSTVSRSPCAILRVGHGLYGCSQSWLLRRPVAPVCPASGQARLPGEVVTARPDTPPPPGGSRCALMWDRDQGARRGLVGHAWH